MRKLMGVALSVLLAVSAVAGPPVDLDTSGVVALIGRHSIGHACPVGDSVGLTAAHVIDLKWYDPEYPLSAYRYQTESGDVGLARPRYVLNEIDIGVVSFSNGVSVHYKIADHAPKIGEKVYWVEYELDKVSKALQPKVEEAEVINVVAGTIWTDEAPTPGSSGGCLLSATSEVYGIVSAGWIIGGGYRQNPNVGQFIGVYGVWGPPLEEKDGGT